MRDGVLLPLQTAVAPQPDVRHGAAAEGSDVTAEGFQVLVAQLQPGERSPR